MAVLVRRFAAGAGRCQLVPQGQSAGSTSLRSPSSSQMMPRGLSPSRCVEDFRAIQLVVGSGALLLEAWFANAGRRSPLPSTPPQPGRHTSRRGRMQRCGDRRSSIVSTCKAFNGLPSATLPCRGRGTNVSVVARQRTSKFTTSTTKHLAERHPKTSRFCASRAHDTADEQRRRRTHWEAGLNTYAEKRYGEDWQSRRDADRIAEEFDDWLERRGDA
jgi:hypothetical protein